MSEATPLERWDELPDRSKRIYLMWSGVVVLALIVLGALNHPVGYVVRYGFVGASVAAIAYVVTAGVVSWVRSDS